MVLSPVLLQAPPMPKPYAHSLPQSRSWLRPALLWVFHRSGPPRPYLAGRYHTILKPLACPAAEKEQRKFSGFKSKGAMLWTRWVLRCRQSLATRHLRPHLCLRPTPHCLVRTCDSNGNAGPVVQAGGRCRPGSWQAKLEDEGSCLPPRQHHRLCDGQGERRALIICSLPTTTTGDGVHMPTALLSCV